MKILVQNQVAFYRKEKPALFGGKNGWLFLIEDKLIFTKTGKSRLYRTNYNEKELEKFCSEGKVQLEIPLSEVVEAVAGTKIGAPYVMVRYRSQKGEEVASFMGYETGSYLYNLDIISVTGLKRFIAKKRQLKIRLRPHLLHLLRPPHSGRTTDVFNINWTFYI